MIQIFVLMAQLTGGLAMMPFGSLDACQAAMAGLPPAIVVEVECYEIEMIAPSNSRLAPETAPLPVPKPVPKPGQEA